MATITKNHRWPCERTINAIAANHTAGPMTIGGRRPDPQPAFCASDGCGTAAEDALGGCAAVPYGGRVGHAWAAADDGVLTGRGSGRSKNSGSRSGCVLACNAADIRSSNSDWSSRPLARCSLNALTARSRSASPIRCPAGGLNPCPKGGPNRCPNGWLGPGALVMFSVCTLCGRNAMAIVISYDARGVVIAYTRPSAPHVAISCPTPPGSEGSKGKRALSGTWGVLSHPSLSERSPETLAWWVTPHSAGASPPGWRQCLTPVGGTA